MFTERKRNYLFFVRLRASAFHAASLFMKFVKQHHTFTVCVCRHCDACGMAQLQQGGVRRKLASRCLQCSIDVFSIVLAALKHKVVDLQFLFAGWRGNADNFAPSRKQFHQEQNSSLRICCSLINIVGIKQKPNTNK